MPKNTARKIIGWRQVIRPKSAVPTPRNPATVPAKPMPETPVIADERSAKESWDAEGGQLPEAPGPAAPVPR